MSRASPGQSSTSRRAAASASAGEAPRARAARQASSSCCARSSTISASRSGRSPGSRRRSRTYFRQSGMIAPHHAVDRVHELPPGGALPAEGAPAVGREAVEAAAPRPGALQPAPPDGTPVLETAQHRVERGDPQLQLAARAPLDRLADVVAVPRPGFEQRQDQQLGAPFLQLATEHGVPRRNDYLLPIDILYRDIYRRQAACQDAFTA